MDDAYWKALAEIDGEIPELVDVVFARPAWHSRAACRGKAELFYLERGRRPRTSPPTLRCGSGTVAVR
jgi:hypothetical protein